MNEFEQTDQPYDLFSIWYAQVLDPKNSKGKKSLKEKLRFRIKNKIQGLSNLFVPSMERVHNNAVMLSTANKSGKVSSRVVLLKEHSEKGFVFYTNYDSAKALDIFENPQVSLNFFWSSPPRQVRVEGRIKKVPREQSEKYWKSRPRLSQLGALASSQSQKISRYEDLIDNYKKLQEANEGQSIPLPKNWGGYIVEPIRYEFWQGMPNRLHKRISFEQGSSGWSKYFLAP